MTTGDATVKPNSYRTYDFVVMALLAAISAVAYAGLAQVWAALTAATGPLGGAFLGLFRIGKRSTNHICHRSHGLSQDCR